MLRYKPDYEEACDRLSAWWGGEDIGRPALQIHVPRATPWEEVPLLPTPQCWITHYSIQDFAYRVNSARRACLFTDYLAEAMPSVSPDLAPNCLALYLGSGGVESPGTVWCTPCITDPEFAEFRLDESNIYWEFTLQLASEQLRHADRFLTSFPDLIEGLDTLAAMRGTQALLTDLLDRPDWVHASLAAITDCYFTCYDRLYDMLKDDRGGSHFWAWAPGRMAKLQCDFSAMISPDMFADFMVPVLHAMTERLDTAMYHWDGPGAIAHHDHLLSVPGIDILQWTPGDGVEALADRRWWPLYHKTVDAGKKMHLRGLEGLEEVRILKREFGPKLKQFLLHVTVESLREADELIRTVSN